MDFVRFRSSFQSALIPTWLLTIVVLYLAAMPAPRLAIRVSAKHSKACLKQLPDTRGYLVWHLSISASGIQLANRSDAAHYLHNACARRASVGLIQDWVCNSARRKSNRCTWLI